MRLKVITVFVKSWKNATEQHYQDNKTDKNNGTDLERTFNFLNLDFLFITAHFVMKMSINDVLCQKTVTYLATCECPMSTRATARQVILHEGCFNENLTTKKLRHSWLSKLGSEAYDVLGIMLNKYIIDIRKSCFDFYEITALSLCRRFNMSVQLHFFNFL